VKSITKKIFILLFLVSTFLINVVTINAEIFYRVASGSFKILANATSQLNFVKSKGYSDAYIKNENELYTVYIGSFKSQSNAINFVNTAKKSGVDAIIKIADVEVANSPKRENNQGLSFKLISSTGYKVDFNTPWIKEPKSGLLACLNGKGEYAIEEGLADLVIKDKNGNIKVYKLAGDPLNDYTPKKVKWIDENNLFVIIGFPFGTVTRGGGLYILDLTTLKLGEVYVSKSSKIEVTDFNLNGTTLEMVMNIYIDDNYINSTKEKWTISNFDTNLRNKMEIKDSKGKIVGTIN